MGSSTYVALQPCVGWTPYSILSPMAFLELWQNICPAPDSRCPESALLPCRWPNQDGVNRKSSYQNEDYPARWLCWAAETKEWYIQVCHIVHNALHTHHKQRVSTCVCATSRDYGSDISGEAKPTFLPPPCPSTGANDATMYTVLSSHCPMQNEEEKGTSTGWVCDLG